MKILYHSVLDFRVFSYDVVGSKVTVGRAAQNDVVLNNPMVPQEALKLEKRGPRWELTALGMEGCRFGNLELAAGDRLFVDATAEITLFPFKLTLELNQAGQTGEAELRRAADEQVGTLIRETHVAVLSTIESTMDSKNPGDTAILRLERALEEIARSRGVDNPKSVTLPHMAALTMRGEVIDRLISSARSDAKSTWAQDSHWSRLMTAVPELEKEIAGFTDKIVQALGLKSKTDLTEQMELIESGFWPHWHKQAPGLMHEFKLYLALRYLKKQIKDIMFGYGPLEDLLRAPAISEIMVVDSRHIYVEQKGVVENSGRHFVSDEVTLAIIERIVAKVGRRIDKSQPLVDARLSDGSRVNAVIPPIAVSGPTLTIRKFPARKVLIEDLVRLGSLTTAAVQFLRGAVLVRKNIIVSGGTGTGKTTLLNCLSDFIPDKERIVTIEDTAELQLKKEHVVRLETKPANIEGAGAYTIRDLVKNSLRMRPDRIVVGECRGGETLDMLQAMNTGHDGSLTTIHSNSAVDAMMRLEVLVQMAGPMPVESIQKQIVSAVDLVVQLHRMRDGRRRVVEIAEVIDRDEKRSCVRLRNIFDFSEHGAEAGLRPTGQLPTFMGELIDTGSLKLEDLYL